VDCIIAGLIQGSYVIRTNRLTCSILTLEFLFSILGFEGNRWKHGNTSEARIVTDKYDNILQQLFSQQTQIAQVKQFPWNYFSSKYCY